ncbi:MAG: ABC transporter permease [Micromonosporaceae bacterium]
MAYDGLSERTQRIDEWPETGGEEPVDRDRFVVHGIWEGLLLVLVAVAAVVAYQVNPGGFGVAGVSLFLLSAASLGFLAVGTAWSLRAAVPNLATGPIAAGAAMYFAQQSEGGLAYGIGITLAVAVTLGVVLTVVVVGFGLPAWAVTLAAALGLVGWLGALRSSVDLAETLTYAPKDHALYWFVGFAAISVAGGMILLIGPLRRGIAACRTSGDPAERPSFGAGLAALAALVGSSALAALAGVLTALTVGAGVPRTGVELTGMALGAVLIGGTSVYGRRGGVFGTLFGVLLVTMLAQLIVAGGWSFPLTTFAAAVVLLGLLVSRLVERLGRPRTATESEEWDPEARRPETGGPALPPGGSGEQGDWGAFGDPQDQPRGGIGDRAARLQQTLAVSRQGPGQYAEEPDGTTIRTRIWDTDPRGGAPTTPSPY